MPESAVVARINTNIAVKRPANWVTELPSEATYLIHTGKEACHFQSESSSGRDRKQYL